MRTLVLVRGTGLYHECERKTPSLPHPPPSLHSATSEGYRGPTAGWDWMVGHNSITFSSARPRGRNRGTPRQRRPSHPCKSAPGFHSQGDRERHRGSSHLCNHRLIEPKINDQVINTYANVTCSEAVDLFLPRKAGST